MIEAAIAAGRQCFSPPFRATLWKVLALTLVALVLVWMGLDRLALSLIAADAPWTPSLAPVWPWLKAALSILTGVGLVVGLAFVVAPVSMLVASFFLDDLAEIVEREDPSFPPGRPVPVGEALWLGGKFALVSLAVNFGALLVFLIPGVNAIVFFVANAYLFGREYFELAALRYRPIEEVRAMRRAHSLEIFVAGFFVAAFVAVPVLNLVTPLFGTAFMVRLHRDMTKRALSRQAISPAADARRARG